MHQSYSVDNKSSICLCIVATILHVHVHVVWLVALENAIVYTHACCGPYLHDYSDTRKRERKTTQHNTTQDLRQLFPKKKLHSGGTRTHTSLILAMMLYQLSYCGSSSWLSSKSPTCIYTNQGKAKWASQPDKQVNLIVHEHWVYVAPTSEGKATRMCTCVHAYTCTYTHARLLLLTSRYRSSAQIKWPITLWWPPQWPPPQPLWLWNCWNHQMV